MILMQYFSRIFIVLYSFQSKRFINIFLFKDYSIGGNICFYIRTMKSKKAFILFLNIWVKVWKSSWIVHNLLRTRIRFSRTLKSWRILNMSLSVDVDILTCSQLSMGVLNVVFKYWEDILNMFFWLLVWMFLTCSSYVAHFLCSFESNKTFNAS